MKGDKIIICRNSYHLVSFIIFFFKIGRRRPFKCATPLTVALSPGHSDITRFRPWSPIDTGNHLDRAEKIAEVVQTTGIVDVFDPP